MENVNEEDKDVKEDDKKRKRDEREEKEEKNVLFPILEKDKGGRPPLKVLAFKELFIIGEISDGFLRADETLRHSTFLHSLAPPTKWKDPLY